jgi:mono/diheme cytochrome c family protein
LAEIVTPSNPTHKGGGFNGGGFPNSSPARQGGDTWLARQGGDTWLARERGDGWLARQRGDTWLARERGDTWLTRERRGTWLAGILTRRAWIVANAPPIFMSVFVLMSVPMSAQDARAARGEKVFSTNCSVPYCHGPNGTAGRAPKLVGHSFTARDLTNTVSNGIANKGMPAFGKQLSSDDLDSVVGYVMTLRGSSPEPANAAAPVRSVAAEAPGKALFFDAVRMGGCGRCHELEKRGSRVAPDIKSLPVDLRTIDATRTVTVSPAGEPPFPGFVVEQSEKRVLVYDLSSRLPVLRTFAGGVVKATAGSSWKHQDAVREYSDTELRDVALYLQSAIAK